MKHVKVSGIIFVLLLLCVTASAKTIYVPDNCTKIQWAIDNATAGDTIVVKAGTYYEYNIVVDKKLTLTGIGLPIIDGLKKGNIMAIKADGCVINGIKFYNVSFDKAIVIEDNVDDVTIKSCEFDEVYKGIYAKKSNLRLKIANNSFKDCSYGVYLHYASESEITLNNFKDCDYGIYISHSDNNTITDNYFKSCGDYGVYAYYSDDLQITENNFYNCDDSIRLYGSDDCIISNNEIISSRSESICLANSLRTVVSDNVIKYSGSHGIYLDSSNYAEIINNSIISGHSEGIYLYSSSYNNIVGNTITKNDGHGIRMYWHSNNNVIKDNDISRNKYSGIYLNNYCEGNTIVYNAISRNGEYGIRYYYYSKNNTAYLNDLIENYKGNAYTSSYSTNNTWNSTQTFIYAYKGRIYENYLGNYWSDYSGSDSDNDGIGDTAYIIDSSNKDNYPLMQSYASYFSPSVGIETDKTTYTARDKMNVTISIANPTYDTCKVRIVWRLSVPAFNYNKTFANATLTLTSMFEKTYTKTFTLPLLSVPFDAVWTVELYSKGELLSKDEAKWSYKPSIIPTMRNNSSDIQLIFRTFS